MQLIVTDSVKVNSVGQMATARASRVMLLMVHLQVWQRAQGHRPMYLRAGGCVLHLVIG